MVVPVDPFSGGELDIIDAASRFARFDQLGFVEPVDHLGQGVVPARSDRTDGGGDPGLSEPFGQSDRRVLRPAIAEAARREKVSEQSIGRWKAEFLEAGKAELAAGKSGPSTREQQLEAEVSELTQALGKAHLDRRPKGPVAATGPRDCPGSGNQSCVGQASVGTSQNLGVDPTRWAPGVAVSKGSAVNWPLIAQRRS